MKSFLGIAVLATLSFFAQSAQAERPIWNGRQWLYPVQPVQAVPLVWNGYQWVYAQPVQVVARPVVTSSTTNTTGVDGRPTPYEASGVAPGAYPAGTQFWDARRGHYWNSNNTIFVSGAQPNSDYAPYEESDGIKRLPRYKYRDGGQTRLKLVEEEGYEEKRKTHVGENHGRYIVQRKDERGRWEDVGEDEVGEAIDREEGSRKEWAKRYR